MLLRLLLSILALGTMAQAQTDCVGAWGTCDSNCKKRYKVTTAKVGAGKACPVMNGMVGDCTNGQGACVITTDCDAIVLAAYDRLKQAEACEQKLDKIKEAAAIAKCQKDAKDDVEKMASAKCKGCLAATASAGLNPAQQVSHNLGKCSTKSVQHAAIMAVTLKAKMKNGCPKSSVGCDLACFKKYADTTITAEGCKAKAQAVADQAAKTAAEKVCSDQAAAAIKASLPPEFYTCISTKGQTDNAPAASAPAPAATSGALGFTTTAAAAATMVTSALML
jgi:hypothetical protein